MNSQLMIVTESGRGFMSYGQCRSAPPMQRLSSLAFLREHCLDALLHFFGRNVFLVGGDPPEMAEWVFELAGTVSVKLVHHRLALCGAGSHRLFAERVHILDVEMDADRRAAERLRRFAAVLRKFIRQHDQRIAKSDFP